MASDVELRKIKKKYGEKFMHMCRDLFPTILEEEGVLFSILEKIFANNSRTLYEDIHDNSLEGDFKDFIYAIFDNKSLEKQQTEKTPYDLLDEAGYTLYECKTEKEIQEFKKYYREDEELCTFNGGRLSRCAVFFAVRKNVNEIRREDFISPKREDEYGTSVMSIQFYKMGISTVSIKNRYNHTVNNPDATYGNDLDRIIPGLEQSFKNLLAERGLILNSGNVQELEIPNYVVAGGKYYKYNLEIEGIYFCPGNIVIYKGEVISIGSPEKKILVENFIIDLENKIVSQCDFTWYTDSFVDDLDDIEQIEIVRDKESKNGERTIIIKNKDSKFPIEIRIDRDNQIIGYKNLELQGVSSYFLQNNRRLKYLELPMLERAGDSFLEMNRALETLTLPKLKDLGAQALSSNRVLHELVLPELYRVGFDFLCRNERLEQLDLPKLQSAQHDFLSRNSILSSINLPKLERAKDGFLRDNTELEHLDLPNLREAGNEFLYANNRLQSVYFPKLRTAGRNFLFSNSCLRDLRLPALTSIGYSSLINNRDLLEIDLPSITNIGNNFMSNNEKLRKINMPQLATVGTYFLSSNLALEELSLPSLRRVDRDFLSKNKKIKSIYLPNLERADNNFLMENTALVSIELPKLRRVGNYFLFYNKGIIRVEMPLLEQVLDDFMRNNLQLKYLKLPSLLWAGSNFLHNNRWLRQLELERLLRVEDDFLFSNKGIKCLNLPNLEMAGSYFMPQNDNIECVKVPRLNRRGKNFLGDTSKKITREHLARLDKRRQINTYDIGEGKKIVIGLLATIDRY